MFLKDSDEALVRMGAEIVFLRQLVEAQKTENEQLKKDKQNGYEQQGTGVLETKGSSEEPSVLG